LAVSDVGPNVKVLQDEKDSNNPEDGELPLIRLPPMVFDYNLCSLTRSLNSKQRQYYVHVMHNVAAKKSFYEYVGGGAGVGKSRLISTIFQSITWRANKFPVAIDSAEVLLCAPTGKSAFGIREQTLHSVFSLPVNQTSGPLRPLSNDTLNTMTILKFMN